MAIFIGAELLIGGMVGNLLIGVYMSHSLKFMLQGILNLLSFFVGGFIIGVISPGLRIHEPAAGAFLTVALMLGLTLFTPYTIFRFSVTKLIIGGFLAFFLALSGSIAGEKLMGNRIPEE
ncbi:MAG: hypothetical protein ACE5FU_06485 [Nitrospinota bacterium]